MRLMAWRARETPRAMSPRGSKQQCRAEPLPKDSFPLGLLPAGLTLPAMPSASWVHLLMLFITIKASALGLALLVLSHSGPTLCCIWYVLACVTAVLAAILAAACVKFNLEASVILYTSSNSCTAKPTTRTIVGARPMEAAVDLACMMHVSVLQPLVACAECSESSQHDVSQDTHSVGRTVCVHCTSDITPLSQTS